MPKHFFFDLDNTLTPSKSHILPEHAPIFLELCERADVIVVSGHGPTDIRAHLEAAVEGKYHILGQNGNYCELKDGTVLWNHSLTDEQKHATYAFIDKAKRLLGLTVRDESDLVEDRDSQIAYSLIGHHEDHAVKNAFDPKHEKRLGLLATLKADVEVLKNADVEVRSGGTTVLDFFAFGKNKGHNVAAFIKAMQWVADDCVYVGDALFPGGNDETVVGVITTQAVNGPEDTFAFISKMLH